MDQKPAIGLVLFSALALPFFVKAAFRADPMSQIQALEQQLKQLQVAAAQEPSAFCHNFQTNLRLGAAGQEVAALRQALSREGILIKGGDPARPYYGPQTAAAVRQFQEKYRAEVLTPQQLQSGTGVLGSGTRSKLNELYGCQTVQNWRAPMQLNFPPGMGQPRARTELSSKGGQLRTVQRFELPGMAADIVNYYQNRFNQAGWQVVPALEGNTVARGVFYANRGNRRATVQIQYDSIRGVSDVILNFIAPSK
ncbi:MAG: peptidoglycan-binding protein [Candidatus Liptonbacteria bacterium]|nr:peptidoglycan-binding protein [Candidatus Liptonbacteria bacterium]